MEVDLRSYKEIVRLLDELKKFSTNIKPLFDEIGLFLSSRIKLRTADGVDASLKRFKPYSTRHAAKRASLGLPIGKVDLFFTGSMLSSMTHTAAADQVRLFFAPTQDKFGGNNPAKAYFINEGQGREFFAIGDKDTEMIMDLAVKRLDELLRKESSSDLATLRPES